jgi:Tol biopolymer transport system component
LAVALAFPVLIPKGFYVSRKLGAAPIAGAVFALAFAAVAVVHFREATQAPQAMRFSIQLPDKTEIRPYDMPVLSPDGTRMVFSVSSPQGDRLALRTLDNPVIKILADTNGGFFPFWSPDGSKIAFGTRQGLRRIDLAGGPAVSICDTASCDTGGFPGGGAWNRKGVILLGGTSGIMRVSAVGGTQTHVTRVNPNRGETAHRWPFFLPDGKHFLFTINSARSDVRGIYIGDLESSRTVRLVSDETNGQYSPPGFLLFTRADVLTAQPFDAHRLRLAGDPFPVAEKLRRWDFALAAMFSTAAGELVYATVPGVAPYQMIWFDRKGARLSSVGAIAEYSNPALSLDGRTLAVCIRDATTRKRDIWLFDLVRGANMRLTFDPADDLNPIWSPDGRQIIFSSDRRGARDLYRKVADGASQEELLLESTVDKNAEDLTRDGKHLVYNTGSDRHDLWAVEPSGKATKPAALLTGSFSQNQARISPDGRWLAYSSNESGKFEVYVQNFPPSGGKWQISNAGGTEPQWRADGKEIFYVQDDKTLIAVGIVSRPGLFEFAIPEPLFDAPFTPKARNRFVVSGDGQRFLVMTRSEHSANPFTLVLNWTAGIKP